MVGRVDLELEAMKGEDLGVWGGGWTGSGLEVVADGRGLWDWLREEV